MNNDRVEKLHQLDFELVIGLVGAVGTDLGRVGDLLSEQIVRTGYQVHRIRVSHDVIPHFQNAEFEESNEFDRITKMMDAGNSAREASGDNSVLALGSAVEIGAKRTGRGPSYKNAFIIQSLKRPEEAERLRKIYPGGFVLLGVHSEEPRRLEELKNRGISSLDAQELIKRDSNENKKKFGQRLEKTFYLSDFFVRLNGNDDLLKCELRRIIELLFGHPFHTPSFDEYAMFFAFAAALRSADLSRQVGSVIARNNQILATGANDCPKSGGGLYWPERNSTGCLEDTENGRDFKRGFDSNKQEQQRIIEKLVELSKGTIDEEELRSILSSKDSPIVDLTEYGRVVHAEMDSLLACSRGQISTAGATIYCTTFPCHNCAKHIVAAGISRVVYIEPYEKSKAADFHRDSIVFGSESIQNGKVKFEPFNGIGPRRFFDLL